MTFNFLDGMKEFRLWVPKSDLVTGFPKVVHDECDDNFKKKGSLIQLVSTRDHQSSKLEGGLFILIIM